MKDNEFTPHFVMPRLPGRSAGFAYDKSGWNLHMMPVGYLMIEHRLIERMVKLMASELEKIIKENKIDLTFIDAAVDFIKTYADKCHHGKEEDILFRGLSKKKMSSEHKKIMEELIQEHKMGRQSVSKLIGAKDGYSASNAQGTKEIQKHIKWLIEFYPQHIAKEDKDFFIPCMGYFDKDEQNKMLKEFYEFDGASIQETYRKIVQKLEKEKAIN